MIYSTMFYIDGEWIHPKQPNLLEVINPATEEPVGKISLGTKADVDCAVRAARAAFETFSHTTKQQRVDLLHSIIRVYERRQRDLANIITNEMGAPLWFSSQVHVATALAHFRHAVEILRDYDFGHMMGGTRIVREAIGVCGLITPWNWPVNQIVGKFVSALAAGCTCVVKPSEIAPLSAIVLAEILHEAGVPKGVFNLVNGEGLIVGQAIAEHPDVDMVSFTGSTRSGVMVAQAAAPTVKRVHQELGGKSANIILPGTELEATISAGVLRAFTNSGQSCQAPTSLLVARQEAEQAIEIAKRTAEAVVVGDPMAEGTRLGPLVSRQQFDRVQNFISLGISEGARLVAGGSGPPLHLNKGYYCRPTIFADVTPQMTIAREEIFGPVLPILTYESEDEAVEIANGTVYGLAAYVFAPDLEQARRVGLRLRAGRVYLNGASHGAPQDVEAPFGGYKQSGNGREAGVYGLEEFLEIKALIGYNPA